MQGIPTGFIFPFISKLAEGLPIKMNLKELANIACKQSLPLKRFLDDIASQIKEFQKNFELMEKIKLEVLSHELHFNGTHVLKYDSNLDLSNSQVIYSNKRVNSSLFFNICSWISSELKIPLFCRTPPIFLSSNIKSRSYVQSSPITDGKLCSYYSGILLAICHFFAVTDLHYDNVIFNGNIPVVIDDECVCQPIRANQLKVLNKKSKLQPLSPFRSLLLPWMPDIKSSEKNVHETKYGLYDLVKQNRIDIQRLIEGYSLGFITIKKFKQPLIDICYSTLKIFPYARYLVRSTQFYLKLKEIIALQLFFSDEKIASNKAKDSFQYEEKKFPELNLCIDNEIKDLMRGNTPYWIINLLNGELSNNIGDAACMTLKEKPLEQMLENFDNISRMSLDYFVLKIEKTINDLRN